MSRKRFVFAAIMGLALLFCSGTAKAWSCPTGQHNVEVPKGTAGARLIEGLYFVCQPIDTPKPPSDPTAKADANSNSSSSATSKSSSNSSSTSTASQKQNQTQQQGQNQTATGGNAAASASNNGNGSNNSSFTSNVAAPEIPVSTAIAVAPSATVPCFKGYGAAGQGSAIGLSLSGGKVDENCAILEAARSAAATGNRMAYCKVYLTNKYVKKSGLTLAECLKVEPAAPVVQAPAPQPSVVVLPAPAVTIQQAAPAVAVAQSARLTVGEFRMNQIPGSGICPKARAIVTPAGKVVLDKAIAANGKIYIQATIRNAAASLRYLQAHGATGLIDVQDDANAVVSVSVWSDGRN